MDPLFLVFIVVALGGLLYMNWRTRRKQQDQLSFRDRLEIGEQVQTVGGVIGTVTAIDGDWITIESTPGTEIVFLRKALAVLIEDPAAAEDDEDDEDELDDTEDTEQTGAADDAELSTDQGEDAERGGSAVASSPAVPDEVSTSVSPDAGDDDSPRSTQN